MDQQRLDYVLQQHENYVRTDGKAGKPADLSSQDLSGCVIENRSMLTGLKLDEANLERAKISNCNLDGVSSEGSNCTGIRIDSSLLTGANFARANLRGAQIDICRPDFYEGGGREGNHPVNFSSANLEQAFIHMSDLNGAILKNAQMNGIYLRMVRLNRANLSGAYMERARIVHGSIKEANCAGLVATRAVFGGLSLDRSNLTGSDLSYSLFDSVDAGAVFSGSTLVETNLDRSNLYSSDFQGCDLSRSTFRDAVLKHCKFQGCNVEGTNFINASHLKMTSFHGTVPNGADFNQRKVEVKLITTPAAVDKINDALTESGYREQVELGLTDKLKLINFVKGSNLYNPFPDKTIGRLYTSFLLGNRPDSVDDVITQENLGDYSVADVLFGIKWLINQSADMSE